MKKEINKNKILNDQIITLQNDLNIKNKNELNKFKEVLTKKINEFNKDINQEINKFIDSQNIRDENNSIEDNDVIQLYKKIDELNEKLSRYPFELLKGEKLISVIFTSSDEKIHHSIICKNTEKFIKLEEQLYNYYPEYSESDNYFMVNGNRVNKFKTLDENQIKNSDIINLTKIEFENMIYL